MDMKKFWKEITIVVVLTLVLSMGFDFIGERLTPSNVMSPLVIVLGVVGILMPLFATILGGYIVGKKSRKILDAILVCGIGAALAGIVLIMYSLITLLLMDAEGWSAMLETAGPYMQKSMTVEEFKDFTLYATILSGIIVTFLNFGLGAIGGIIGRFMAK